MDHIAGGAGKRPVGDGAAVPLGAGAGRAAEVIALRRARLAGTLLTRLPRAARP